MGRHSALTLPWPPVLGGREVREVDVPVSSLQLGSQQDAEDKYPSFRSAMGRGQVKESLLRQLGPHGNLAPHPVSTSEGAS